jgi:hypothetical protein
MTGRQRVVVWAWVGVVVAAGLFPPWVGRDYPKGYHFLFQPEISGNQGGTTFFRSHVDHSRLALEWVVATVAALGFFFAWPERAKERRASSALGAPPVPPTLQELIKDTGYNFVWDRRKGKWVQEDDPEFEWEPPTHR